MSNKTQGKDYDVTEVKQRHKLRQGTLFNGTQGTFQTSQTHS